MITTEFKHRVLSALKQARENFGGSDAKFAVSIGINAAQWSRVKNGDIDKVLADASWISLGRQFNVNLREVKAWKTANTPFYEFITEQLALAQENSRSFICCDDAEVGKTYCSQLFAKTRKNVVYVDCAQVKTKQQLVRYIAKSFGVGHTGRYADVYSDLVFYIRCIDRPLIILDEAGDLAYQAFLEIKALWNATEGFCGWVMLGADGLKEKIRRSIDHKKVGYTELFSRFGSRYMKLTPEGAEERRKFQLLQAALVIKANLESNNTDAQRIIAQTDGRLRRIYDLVKMTA
jgi:DNA transposition AAA+ family ATPase